MYTMKEGFLSHINTQSVLFCVSLLAIGFIGLVCFLPASQYSFTNWDDNILVLQNTAIRDLSVTGIMNLFISFSLNHYHPLVLLSYAIEFQLFGLNPFPFHLTNIILHALNSILVALLVRSLTKNTVGMFVAGILFAVHPLRVESVVWIAERKDVLSAFFTLLSLNLYIHYRQTNKQQHFILAVSCFLCALFSKAMAVTLPILFLLCDFFIDGSLDRKRIREKIPLLLISVVFGVIAVIAQYSTGITSKDPSFHLWKSCFLVPYGLLFYGVKYIYPFHLSPVYPYPETVGATYPLLFWLSPLIVLALVYGIHRLSKLDRLFSFAFLFYAVTILPVLQFIPVGRMIAADRFSYIPLIGLLLATGQGIYIYWTKTANRLWMHGVFLIVFLGVMIWLFTMTREQMSIWQSDKTLWTRVVQDQPSYAEGYNNLGITCAEEGNHADALHYFNYAVHLDSTDAEFFHNRGLLFLQMKRWASAIQDFSRMIALNPQDISGYVLRGNAYFGNKSFRESIADYSQVLRIQPLALQVRLERILALAENGEDSAVWEDINYLRLSGVQLDSAFIKKLQQTPLRLKLH